MSERLKAKVAFSSSSSVEPTGTEKKTKQFVLIVKWNKWLEKKGLTKQQITTINRAITIVSASLAGIVSSVLAVLGAVGVI